jgi:hypothetical protein
MKLKKENEERREEKEREKERKNNVSKISVRW